MFEARRAKLNSESMDMKRAFPDAQQLSGSTVILDIDGTITADGGAKFSRGTLNEIRALAARNVVYLFSNHRDISRNKAIAISAGLPYIETNHRKPSRRIIDAIQVEHRNQPLVVIGDKVMIDELFAWRIGARFIKVRRIVSPGDRRSVRWTYLLDDFVCSIVGYFFSGRQPR
jgi:predicted HAD superfamily phosphohydrolase YqeG